MKKTSLIVLALLAGCTQQQAADTLHHLPHAITKSACQGASNCTFTNTEQRPNPAPDHWYQDGYGRDERVPRR